MVEKVEVKIGEKTFNLRKLNVKLSNAGKSRGTDDNRTNEVIEQMKVDWDDLQSSFAQLDDAEKGDLKDYFNGIIDEEGCDTLGDALFSDDDGEFTLIIGALDEGQKDTLV